MLTYSSVVLSKLKDLSTDVPLATSEILGIDILLQSFLITLGVSQNQSRLQRAKGQLLSYTYITEEMNSDILQQEGVPMLLDFTNILKKNLTIPFEQQTCISHCLGTSYLLPTKYKTIYPSIFLYLSMSKAGQAR